MRRFLAFLMLSLSFNIFAQTNSKWLSVYSGITVTSIAPEGKYLWIGTTGGLIKLDTTNGNIVHYNKNNSNLTGTRINYVLVDSSKKKWICTESAGIVCLENNKWTNYNTQNSSLPANDVLCAAEDKSGTLWFGTIDGLVKYDGSSFTTIKFSFYPNIVNAIAIDTSGNLWLAYEFNGGVKYDGTNATKFNSLNSVLSDNLLTVAVDSNNNVWFGSEGDGLFEYTNGKWINYTGQNAGAPLGYIKSIYITKEGKKYFGTIKGGAAIFDGQNWTTYNTHNSGLPDSTINAIYIDPEGNQYYGTDLGGLAKFDGKSWKVFNTSYSNSKLPYDWIQDISIMDNSKVLIATNGLAILDNSKWEVFNTSNSGLLSNLVFSITTDKDGNIWAATKRGLAEFFKQTSAWFHYTDANGLPWFETLCVSVDKDNNVWVGTTKGAAKLDRKSNTWAVYQKSNSGLPLDFITAIACGKGGKAWIGTFGAGVASFDGQNWVNYQKDNSSLPDNYIIKIRTDKDSNAWFCSYSGLSKFDGNNWTVYDNSVKDYPIVTFDVAFDKKGNVWAATYEGLVKITGNKFTIYNTFNSGLTCNDIRSIAIDSLGNIWLGTTGGISVFNENGIVTSVKNKIAIIPNKLQLFQNYPNPFNPTTTIKYSIPKSIASEKTNLQQVVLKIYDVLGKEVKTLVNKAQRPGNYSVEFNAGNLPSGIYIYRLTAGSSTISKKMILIK